MRCVWCNTIIIPEVNWQTFFIPAKAQNLCETCLTGLQRIQQVTCQICGRNNSDGQICPDCEKWQQDPIYTNLLTFNRSVYQYNEQLKAMITKWKYRGDYLIHQAFQQDLVKTFETTFVNKVPDAVLVPIPLSEKRLYERAFNQAEIVAKSLPYPTNNVLKRVHGEKQAKRTRQARLQSTNLFILETTITKPVILIDDIYTTGTTLRHAAKLLKQNGCPKVYAFTLAR
ncbi:ComF family protein [Paraliobacillus sediminis]|uniref:ComF family protein n=1 Tax=Paraliobacillus sediminis TaxID=1885916 RepID=UPI000E3B8041|nr:ComF family protein [Paraliobacillus sediminis]